MTDMTPDPALQSILDHICEEIEDSCDAACRCRRLFGENGPDATADCHTRASSADSAGG